MPAGDNFGYSKITRWADSFGASLSFSFSLSLSPHPPPGQEPASAERVVTLAHSTAMIIVFIASSRFLTIAICQTKTNFLLQTGPYFFPQSSFHANLQSQDNIIPMQHKHLLQLRLKTNETVRIKQEWHCVFGMEFSKNFNKLHLMAKLNDSQLAAAAASLPGWDVTPQRLVREFRFKDFQSAFEFMTLCAQEAEAANHHPDWSNSYNKVSVALSTHSENGVTSKDTELAKKFSDIFEKLVAR